jgi:hypothetical protein
MRDSKLNPWNAKARATAYFFHNTYVAEVGNLKHNGNNPVIENADVDLRIIANPDAAKMKECGMARHSSLLSSLLLLMRCISDTEALL